MATASTRPAELPAAAPDEAAAAGGGPTADGRPLVLVLLVAWAALALAGIVGGIFAAQVGGFEDGGATVRIGLPVARTLHDAAAAATVGLLILAGTIIPETARTRRRVIATRWAASTAGIWFVAGAAVVLLKVADVSGVKLSDPGYPAQVSSVVGGFEEFRAALVSLALIATVALGALLVKTRYAITWMAGLSLAALLPLALGGHAGGAADHATAVNALGVHLVGVAAWLGGLLALAILSPVLGSALGVCVARYSVLAGWCYAAVAASGVLFGWLRLGGPSGLSSRYGAVLLAKVVLLVALGGLGYVMRSRIVRSISDGSAAAAAGAVRPAFVRLALVEIALLGAALGLGVGLSRSAAPVTDVPSTDIVVALTGYPAPAGPLQGAGWLTTFRPDWLFLSAGAVGVGLYLAGVLRLRRRGDRWPVRRTVCWIAGWAVLMWATSGAPGVYGALQFSVHMFMHMLLSMVIPIGWVLGAPITLASRALAPRKDATLGPRELLLAVAHSRYLSFWAHPLVAATNFAGSLIVFYYTGLFEFALREHVGHLAMIVHFLLAGYVFSWVLVGPDPGPRRWPPALRLFLLFGTMVFHAFFAVSLMSGQQILAPDFYRQLSLPWIEGDKGILADQLTGGGITWGIGEGPMLLLAVLVGAVWMRSDEADARRGDRQAARDDDAALEAYNADLARRAAASQGSTDPR